MDILKEKEFVEKYLDKRVKDRVLFELSSKNKRQSALMRFCHNVEDIISPTIKHIKISTVTEQTFANEKTFYVLSDKFINGEIMDTDRLVNYLQNEYLGVIAIGEYLCVIKSEYESSSAEYYLLKKYL